MVALDTTFSSRPEMHDGLGDLRADAADDAIGTHQPGRRNGLDQVLRDQRVDRRHAGNVDDGDLRFRADDPLQQIFHHDLGARAVQRADQRQRENALPQFDHWRRQLQQFLLLSPDDLLPRSLVAFEGVQPELVEKPGCQQDFLGKPVNVIREFATQQPEQRLPEGEHETRRFSGGKPLDDTLGGEILQQLPHGSPIGNRDGIGRTQVSAVTQFVQKPPGDFRRFTLRLLTGTQRTIPTLAS